jgi:hypothetical protein
MGHNHTYRGLINRMGILKEKKNRCCFFFLTIQIYGDFCKYSHFFKNNGEDISTGWQKFP